MKRARGTGIIEQLKSGKFRPRLRISGGKFAPLDLCSTREEAEASLNAARYLLGRGEFALTESETIETFGERFLSRRESERQKSAPSARRLWEAQISKAPFFRWPIENVAAKHIRSWIREVRKNRAAQTTKNALNLLRVCLEEAVEEELISRNPAFGVKVKRKREDSERKWTILNPEQQNVLLNALPYPERLLAAFALGSGLRLGEQWALELKDVHLDHETPFVVVRYGGPNHATPKSGVERKVFLFGLALDALRKWLLELESYVARNPHGLVFPSKNGFMRENRFRLWIPRQGEKSGYLADWKKLVSSAGLPSSLRWHDLRHTCASSLINGWWGRLWRLEEVKELLGHKSITTTELYAHFNSSVLHRAASETSQAWRSIDDPQNDESAQKKKIDLTVS